MGLADELDGQAELVEIRKTAIRLQRQLAAAKARSEDWIEAVYNAAHDAAVVSGRGVPFSAPSHDRRNRHAEIALLHTTDWQCGKANETFDMDRLEARIADMAAKAIKLAEIQRADHPVRDCTLMLGGDMVEGVTVFPQQAWEVDATLFEQMFRCVTIIESLVRTLAGAFEHVDVWAIHGNHGRLGRKGDFPAADNADRMVYRIAAERVTDKRVAWHLPESWYHVVPIGDYRALLVHGDQIKSFGGNLPAYGILKKVNAWAAGVIEPFTDVYMGHFHTPQVLAGANGLRVFMCGSPESGNEYAKQFIAATGQPSQRLNFIDPERGRVSSEYVIYFDE